MTYINYENDLPKHYVRRYGWLEAAQQQKQAIDPRSSMRYFTFCAEGAIDVFMLELAEILKRSETSGWLEGVYFCETDKDAFGKIADFIGSPEQGFQGDFADIVLFEDNLEGKRLEDEKHYPRETRKRLRIKDTHDRLRQAFPFDIINLDVCGNMFPPRKGIIARLLQSILQILKWQTHSRFSDDGPECEQFTLFLTVRIDAEHTNQDAIAQLEKRVANNIAMNGKFQDAFITQYGHSNVKELVHQNFAEFFCLALPKFMIHHALFELGWKVTCGPTYLYNRNYRDKNQQYQIMHTVSVYERMPKRPDMSSDDQYIQAVTQLVNNSVKWVDKVLNPALEKELVENLNQIKAWREQYQ